MLYLHRVEGATVAVDADEELVALLELMQETLGIARLRHGFFLSRWLIRDSRRLPDQKADQGSQRALPRFRTL